MSRSKQVGVRELRQNLSIYLDRVKKGQTLTVSEHGRAVAELRPLPASADRLAQLLADGAVTAARRPIAALPRPRRWKLDRSVSTLLDELRDDSV
jgi:prevent-host-death family protein